MPLALIYDSPHYKYYQSDCAKIIYPQTRLATIKFVHMGHHGFFTTQWFTGLAKRLSIRVILFTTLYTLGANATDVPDTVPGHPRGNGIVAFTFIRCTNADSTRPAETAELKHVVNMACVTAMVKDYAEYFVKKKEEPQWFVTYTSWRIACGMSLYFLDDASKKFPNLRFQIGIKETKEFSGKIFKLNNIWDYGGCIEIAYAARLAEYDVKSKNHKILLVSHEDVSVNSGLKPVSHPVSLKGIGEGEEIVNMYGGPGGPWWEQLATTRRAVVARSARQAANYSTPMTMVLQQKSKNGKIKGEITMETVHDVYIVEMDIKNFTAHTREDSMSMCERVLVLQKMQERLAKALILGPFCGDNCVVAARNLDDLKAFLTAWLTHLNQTNEEEMNMGVFPCKKVFDTATREWKDSDQSYGFFVRTGIAKGTIYLHNGTMYGKDIHKAVRAEEKAERHPKRENKPTHRYKRFVKFDAALKEELAKLPKKWKEFMETWEAEEKITAGAGGASN